VRGPEVSQGSREGRSVSAKPSRAKVPPWTFLSNHGHVLLTIAADPQIRLRDVAGRIGITPRAVQRIVADLVECRYLERERQGRRNRYRVRSELPMRHPLVAHNEVGSLLKLLMQVCTVQANVS
jgi:hypothetical protein